MDTPPPNTTTTPQTTPPPKPQPINPEVIDELEDPGFREKLMKLTQYMVGPLPPDRADDIVQSVFAKLWEHRYCIRSIKAFTRLKALESERSYRRQDVYFLVMPQRKPHEDNTATAPIDPPDPSPLLDPLEHAILQESLDLLNDEEHAILVSRVVEDRSFLEIAQRYEVSHWTIRRRYQSAIKLIMYDTSPLPSRLNRYPFGKSEP